MPPEAGHPRAKKIILIVATSLAILVVIGSILAFVVPFFVPWTKLNRTEHWCDIAAGRTRRTDYVLYVRVSDETKETELTEAWRSLIGPPPPPRWVLDCAFSPGTRHSPHYAFHGVGHPFWQLKTLLAGGNYTDDARREMLRTFFGLLQTKGLHEAHDYVRALSQRIPDGPVPLDAASLPKP